MNTIAFYLPHVIKSYNDLSFGLDSMTDFFAHQMQFRNSPVSIMGMGTTSTGNTIIAALHQVRSGRTVGHVVIVDGVQAMLETALGEMKNAYSFIKVLRGTNPTTVLTASLQGLESISYILADLENTEASYPTRILAERLFSTRPTHDHGRCICNFLSIGCPIYEIVVDIPHPAIATGFIYTNQPRTRTPPFGY